MARGDEFERVCGLRVLWDREEGLGEGHRRERVSTPNPEFIVVFRFLW